MAISSVVGNSTRYSVEDFEELEREAKSEEYVAPEKPHKVKYHTFFIDNFATEKTQKLICLGVIKPKNELKLLNNIGRRPRNHYL